MKKHKQLYKRIQESIANGNMPLTLIKKYRLKYPKKFTKKLITLNVKKVKRDMLRDSIFDSLDMIDDIFD